MLLVASCSPRLYPSTSVQKDSAFVRVADTLVLRDSIYIDRITTIKEKGDTVFVTNTTYEYRDRWRNKAVHDTTYVEKIKEVEKVLEKEKPLNGWHRFQIWGFWSLLGIALLIVAFKIYKARLL